MSPSDSNPLLDAALLAQLSTLQLDTNHRIAGALVGRHRSPKHGSSIEFAEHKEYTQGDDIRHLDWKAYVKLDRYYVKRFEDETNLRTFILLDTSGSMRYGEGDQEKFRHGCRLAAALAFLLLKQQDNVGLVAFRDRIVNYAPPRARSSYLKDLTNILLSLKPEGETRLLSGLEHLVEHAKHRSLIFVISDFFDSSSTFQKTLSRLSTRHDISLFHVLHPDERQFPFNEMTIFEALEGSKRVIAEPQTIRDTYLRVMETFLENMRSLCVKSGIQYNLAQTEEPIDKILSKYRGSRGERRQGGAHAV